MPRLSHTKQYPGKFTNSKKQTKSAVLRWQDDKKGFVLYDDQGKVLIPLAYPSLTDMREAGVDFTITN